MSALPPTVKRIDTSHIRSPRDPMTAQEREVVRLELQEEMAWVDFIIRETGFSWGELRSDWAQPDDDDAA